MNAPRRRVVRPLLPVVGLAIALAVGVWSRPAVAQSFARQIPLHGVFVLVTMDRVTWHPYEYGTGFFFDAVGDAYTASNVVRDAVKNPYLMLVALVDGAEYAVHVECWNPGSTDRPRTPNRDVAVMHVGPDVPDFPLWSYHPATAPLSVVPLPIDAGGQSVRVVGFGGRRGDRIPQQETPGSVRDVLRAGDGTEILTVAFPGGGLVNGNSGAPVVNGAGRVIGIAVWQVTSAGSHDAVDVSGVAAASLGCVAKLPSSSSSPFPAPVRPL
jgi:hypothetical protein